MPPSSSGALGRGRAEERGRDALADEEPEVGDLAALAAGLHLDLDVADAVDLLDGRREHVLAERLVRRVLALADAQEPAPVGDREPPGRAGPHEPQAVLVERERVLAREPGLDVEVDPGVDGRVVQQVAQRRVVRVPAHPRPLLHRHAGQERRGPPLLPAVRVERVPLDLRLDQAPERVLERGEVLRVEPERAGEVGDPDRVLLDGVVRELVVGVEEQGVDRLPLQERERPLDVDGADVLLEFEGGV